MYMYVIFTGFLCVDRKDTIESENHKLVQDFHHKLGQHLEVLQKNVESSVIQQQQQFFNMKEQLTCFVARKEEVNPLCIYRGVVP